MKAFNIFSASLALLLGWSGAAIAQTETDALRYTRLGIHGSARIQGIGGAQSALGADISNLAVNPAGLGLFRRSEVSGSFGISAFNSNASIMNSQHYSGPSTADSRGNVNVPQAGFILSNRKDDSEGGDWRGTTLGLSITRLNNFNSRISYSGNTTGNPDDWTMVDYFAELANNNGRTKSSLDAEFGDFMTLEGLAYGTYLIDIFEDELGEYAAPVERGKINFNEEIIRRGSQNQIDFGIGTSYKDKLYLGASIGIVSSTFTQERIYRETENDNSTAFSSLQLRDEFTSRGAGLNLKVGAIFRPVDALRLGVSIQTPTAYTFDEIYDRSLSASFSDIGNQTASELPGEFSYSLTTPLRATGGAAFFFNKYGFVSADVEYVNYAGMRFSESDEYGGSTGNYFSGVNSRIEDTFKSAVNFRLGAEGRYEIFRFRAGYALTGDPYKNADIDGKINTFTLGTGIRVQNFYVDAAYTYSDNIRTSYSPYTFTQGESPVVNINSKFTNLIFTVGYNF